MRRWFVACLAFAIVAVGCGDDDARPNPFSTSATTTTQAPATTSATGGDFPEVVRDAFLEGCTEEGSLAVCECTLGEMQDRLTIDEFLQLDETDPIDEAFILDVTQVCLAQTTAASTTTSTTRPAATTSTTGASSGPLTLDEIVSLTVNDLQEFWSDELPRSYDTEYVPIDQVIPYAPSTRNLPACGGEPIPAEVASDNAFYCNPDDYIAWDAEGLFPDLFVEFGDFTVALVLAHEWGHAVQNRVAERGPTIQTELQADCFAGAWTGAIDRGERESLTLEPGDIEEAMAGYLLFRDPPGTTPNDPGAHGSSFDRVNAFRFGVQNGVEGCQGASNDFPVAFIPLTQQDVQTGGDLPFDQTAPLLTESLEAFWEIAFPELFDEAWVPISETIPYLPSTGDVPTCGERELDPEFYVNNAFYCPDGDFVAWDNENLFPSLYQSIGDFALGQVLAHEWATAAQSRAGVPIDGLTAELQADCLSGVFTAAVIPNPNPTSIVLSAGDLDEAVAGFILFGEDPELMDLVGGSAFDRFDAFQNGFFFGASACFEG